MTASCFALKFSAVQLRDHPGLRFPTSWPPPWICIANKPYKKLTGEIGIFAGSRFYEESPTRVFLRMEFGNEPYMGCLVVKDAAFARALHKLLQHHVGKPIDKIGDLDLSQFL